MDLRAFVSDTLTAIIEGVKAAQQQYPGGTGSAGVSHLDRSPEDARVAAHPVQVSFDVALTSISERKAEADRKAGVSIKVLEASLGGSKAEAWQNEAVSRIQFTVPLSLPLTHASDEFEQVARARERKALSREIETEVCAGRAKCRPCDGTILPLSRPPKVASTG